MYIRKSNISFITFIITFFSFNLMSVNVFGTEHPPLPSEVANTVNSKWLARDFNDLDSYITNLYSSFPNYIPAILASSFHDFIYEGHLSDAMQKFNQVKQWVEQNPGVVSEDFISQMFVLEWMLQSEIDMYERYDVNESELQPDPNAVRDLCEEVPFPPIDVLEYCDFAMSQIWTDPNWAYRKKITIQNTNVDSDLNNFPLYVKISSDPNIGAHAQADGDDIRFTLADGVTLLNHEEEAFSITSGSATGHFWVKVPTIYSSHTTDIYMYYGNPNANNMEDVENVWDSSFNLVHHFGENSWNGTSGEVRDSTSNAFNGTRVGDATTTSNGKIGRGGIFDGNDYVSSGDVNLSNNFTLSFWVLHDTDLTEMSSAWYGYPVIKQSADFCVGWQGWTDGWSISFQDSNDTRVFADSTDQYATANTWYHIVGVYDGSYLRIYKNSSQVRAVQKGNYSLYHDGVHVYSGYQWDGLIDELRISNTSRSLAWIKFEYHNQSESDNELTWAFEETK
jgi:hypothetical protein